MAEIKRHRIWVCPGCGRVYIINTVPAQRIDGAKIRVGDKEFFLDVTRLGEPKCLCGQPLGKEGLPSIEGLTIKILGDNDA